ncbi:MAG TPA: hypothetical protein VF631_09890 [Allosphingosinicella sp.]|jgi:hypothetical protein|uniref:hypothetical protein n=1 Tax=Allosphingosinicella sp. TaxID=2823234 RepID=UPI002F28B7DD
MHLWIDNTGLHGAGRCLTVDAKSIYDLKSLLQFSTLIVFAETLDLGSFESGEVVDASAQYRDLLLELGLERSALSIIHKTRDQYAAACRQAAEFASEELEYRFRADERLLLALPHANIPRGAEFQPERTRWIATELTDPIELEKINAEALDNRATDAIYYMLSGSAELRSAVAALIGDSSEWSSGHTFQVESMLRTYLNENLARQVGANYAPAPHRADVTFRQNQWILERINTSLDAIVGELRPDPLGIPSVQAALIRRSKGDPKGLVQEALSMRRRTKRLRRSLAKLQKLEVDSAVAHRRVREEIGELAKEVRFDLKLDTPPRFLDAVSVEFQLGLPGASLEPKAFLDWVRFRFRKGKRAVLTDIVVDAGLLGIDQVDYARLARASTGKSSLAAQFAESAFRPSIRGGAGAG